MVSEVGRQPWIVYNLMKVEDAATGNTGVWMTFIGVVAAVHRAWRVTTVYVLRGMSRRFRRNEEAGETDDYGEDDVPYGPSSVPEPYPDTQSETGREPQEVPT